jgi:hypothetical protein
VGVRQRVELTIDELVLDGFERPGDAVEPIRAELRRRLGARVSKQLGARLEPVARAIAEQAQGAERR